MKTKKKNDKKILETEVNAFLLEWYKNTEEKIEIFDGEKIIYLNQKTLLRHYEEMLKSFMTNRKNYKICGADKLKNFKIYIANKEFFVKTCKDIYDNPEKYYQINEKEDGDYYYGFLKYLWVNENTRLVDVIDAIKSVGEEEFLKRII